MGLGATLARWLLALLRQAKEPRVALSAAVGFLLYLLKQKLDNRPPRPLAVPVLGNLYLLPEPGKPGPGVHKALDTLSKKHGPLMGFYFGNKYTVVIANYQLMHEALKERGEDFAGRWPAASMHILTKGRGIALQDDLELWRRARTALLQAVTMKRQGEKSEAVILEEVHSTVEHLSSECQKANGSLTFSMRLTLKRESLNVLMRLVAGVRFGVEMSPAYREVEEGITEIFKRISAGNPADYMPILGLMGRPKMLDELQGYVDTIYGHIGSWVAHHKQTLDPSNPRDFLDEMIMNQAKSKLTDTDIEVIIWDSMAGGIDTTGTTFEWLVLLLVNFPAVQAKMQAELADVVGHNRLPALEDRHNLPYCNAVICELMRFKHFAPFGIPHSTKRDTTLGGFNIPKDSQVMINFYSIMMDPTCWKDPHLFRPERFLEEESALASAFHDPEVKPTVESYKFCPFGIGKRMCVGFGVGRIVMFLKVCTHVHCFNWEAGPDGMPDYETEIFGVTLVPLDTKLKITPRPAARLARSIEGNESRLYRTL